MLRTWFDGLAKRGLLGPWTFAGNGEVIRLALTAAATTTFLLATFEHSLGSVILRDAGHDGQLNGYQNWRQSQEINGAVNALINATLETPTHSVGGLFTGNTMVAGINNIDKVLGTVDSQFLSQNGSFIHSDDIGGTTQKSQGLIHSFGARMNIHDRMFDSNTGGSTSGTLPSSPDPAPFGAVAEPASAIFWALGVLALLAWSYSRRPFQRTSSTCRRNGKRGVFGGWSVEGGSTNPPTAR